MVSQNTKEEALLSIKIITFNRAQKLKYTLDRLAGSAFRDVPIEVLDNASSDETPEVLKMASAQLPRLSIFRHMNNVSVCSNLLRAYERFESKYCWLLGDDDDYDFSAETILFDHLRNDHHDVIAVCDINPLKSSVYGYSGGALAMQAMGARLYQTFSFLPAIIFRRSLLTSKIIFKCNKAASSLWPHVPLLEAIIENDSRLLVLEKPIILHRPPTDFSAIKPVGFCDMAQCALYLNSNHQIRFMEDMMEVKTLGLVATLRRWATEKCVGSVTLWKLVLFFSIYRYRRPHLNLLICLVLATPRWVLLRARRMFGKGLFKPDKGAPDINERL